MKHPGLRSGRFAAAVGPERHFSHLIYFSSVTLDLRFANLSFRPTLKRTLEMSVVIEKRAEKLIEFLYVTSDPFLAFVWRLRCPKY